MPRPRIWTAPFTAAFAASFFFSLGFWMFVHLPGYLKELGGREAEIGAIFGSLSVSAILIRPWLGRIMDERGRRPVLIFGGVLNLLACAAYLTVHSLGPWVYVIRIVHGLGEAALFSVTFTIAADIVPLSRRTEGLAIFGVSGLLPLSLGGLLGDWLLSRWDYDALFATSAAIAFLALIPCALIRESRPQRDESRARLSLSAIVFERKLMPLWILTLGFSFGLSSYFTFIKTYTATIKIGSVGLFFLAYSIASVALRLFFSWVPDRIGPKLTLVPALLSLCAGILLLGQAGSANTIIISGALCGLGHAYIFPIVSALVVSRAHDNDRGSAMTLFTALFDVGALTGAPILGLVIESSSYGAMFALASATVSFAGLCFYLSDRRSS